MKDVKTKAEVSKRIKKLERKEEVKTFLFNLSVNATERVKCKEERTDDRSAPDMVIKGGTTSAKEVLFRAKQAQLRHHKQKLKSMRATENERDKKISAIRQEQNHANTQDNAMAEIVKDRQYNAEIKQKSIHKSEAKTKAYIKKSVKLEKVNPTRQRYAKAKNAELANHAQQAIKKKTYIKQAKDKIKTGAYHKFRFSNIVKGTGKSIMKLSKIPFQIQRIIGIGMFGMVLIVLIFFISLLSVLSNDTPVETSKQPLSQEVLSYRDKISHYAGEYEVEQYIPLIQAVMMQESGGIGNDPMQASECSYNVKFPNGITDPDYSLEIGIKYFAECLKKADVKNNSDIKQISLALQGYNYGIAYIDWAVKNFGGYTKANATVYSDEMKAKLKINTYGDIDYVPHVLQYYHIGEIVPIALSQVGNVGGKPYWSWYGYPHRVEWCACFVSWVFNEAGLLDQGVVPKFSNCETGIKWFKEHKQWKGRSTIPESEYIIFFDFNRDGKSDHVGIVEKVEGNRIYTIEGNSTGDECRQQSYEVYSLYIVGYGLIEQK